MVMSGFGDQEVPLIPGVVRGVRLWGVSTQYRQHQIAGKWTLQNEWEMRGAYGRQWRPGENVADCDWLHHIRRYGVGHLQLLVGAVSPKLVWEGAQAHSTVPDRTCGCGFWAYWKLEDESWHAQVSKLASIVHGCLVGVIEGYGKVLVGSKGFRCQKARILALAPVGMSSRFGIWQASLIMEELQEKFGVELLSIDEMLTKFPPDDGPPLKDRMSTPDK